MNEFSKSLRHVDMIERTDEELAADARAHLAKNGPLQFVAELLQKLRVVGMPWWTAEQTRKAWPTAARFRWLSQRPDLRQAITTKLTGLPARTARTRTLEMQAELVDTVVDQGDIDADEYEAAFDPTDLAVYGPAPEFWGRFVSRMPWDENTDAHRRIVAWAIRALLADKSTIQGGPSRKPIMPAVEIRSAIPSATWLSKIPVDILIAIDEARLRLEKTRAREPYHARNELAIATPEILANHIPIAELAPIFTLAESALGFGQESAATPAERVEAPRSSGITPLTIARLSA